MAWLLENDYSQLPYSHHLKYLSALAGGIPDGMQANLAFKF